MKIATWNVNSVRTRLEQVVDWLGQNSVDVLCLQETKVIDADFPRSPFEQLGYYIYTSGQKSYNGVAIFSQQPLQNVMTGFTPLLAGSDSVSSELLAALDEQKRVIAGTLDRLRIVNVYVPNGAAVGSEKYEYKLGWLKVLQEYLRSQSIVSPAMCVCGDFNIAPDDRDLHAPDKLTGQIMASEPERQALQEILALGFADAFRKFTTEGGHYSWWDYRTAAFRRNSGWRIDHLYLSPELYQQAIACWIDLAPRQLPKPSDHTPVILEL